MSNTLLHFLTVLSSYDSLIRFDAHLVLQVFTVVYGGISPNIARPVGAITNASCISFGLRSGEPQMGCRLFVIVQALSCALANIQMKDDSAP